MTNYAPNWFSIKQSPLCTDGAKHVYLAIQPVKVLSSDIRTIVEPYISCNAYFTHAENILIDILADSNKHNHQRAFETILYCRLTSSTNNTVRQFKVPNSDFNASDWIDMIDWEETHEPPATKMLSIQQISHFVDSPLILKYPNHTQPIEHCIKLVSEASSTVYNFDVRDGFIGAQIQSRSLMPHFDSKQDYAEQRRRKGGVGVAVASGTILGKGGAKKRKK